MKPIKTKTMKSLLIILLSLSTITLHAQVKTIGVSAPNYDDGKIIFDTTGLHLYSWDLYTLNDNPSDQTQFTYLSGGKLEFNNLKPGRYWLLGKKATSTYYYDFDRLVNIGINNPKTCQGVDSTFNLIDVFDPNMQQVYPNPNPNSPPMRTLVSENFLNYQSYEWIQISNGQVHTASGINYLYGGRPALFTYIDGSEMLYLKTTDNNGCTSLGTFFNYISPMVFPSAGTVAGNGGNTNTPQTYMGKYITDCTGYYISINNEDYKVCNNEVLKDYYPNDSLIINYLTTDVCNTNDSIVYCQMFHPTKGNIYIYSIEKITKNGSTANTKKLYDQPYTLFPNPTTNAIQLSGDFKHETYKITDIHGRIITENDCVSNKEINLKEIAESGILFITIYDDQNQIIQREKIILK